MLLDLPTKRLLAQLGTPTAAPLAVRAGWDEITYEADIITRYGQRGEPVNVSAPAWTELVGFPAAGTQRRVRQLFTVNTTGAAIPLRLALDDGTGLFPAGSALLQPGANRAVRVPGMQTLSGCGQQTWKVDGDALATGLTCPPFCPTPRLRYNGTFMEYMDAANAHPCDFVLMVADMPCTRHLAIICSGFNVDFGWYDCYDLVHLAWHRPPGISDPFHLLLTCSGDFAVAEPQITLDFRVTGRGPSITPHEIGEWVDFDDLTGPELFRWTNGTTPGVITSIGPFCVDLSGYDSGMILLDAASLGTAVPWDTGMDVTMELRAGPCP